MMSQFPKKESYSMGEMARICEVDVVQVMDWFRDGNVRFFETPGGHLRATHATFAQFMDKTGIAKPKGWDQSCQKFKVLLVEDEEDLRDILLELLKDEDRIEVCSENNGFDGLLKITSWKPDLVLLDFMMPGMTGFEVCKRIRKNPDTGDLPILALTSLSTIDNKQAVFDSGISDFLGKPFYSEALLKKVRALLGLEISSNA